MSIYEIEFMDQFEEESIAHKVSRRMKVSNDLVEDILDMSWDSDGYYHLDESQLRYLLAKHSEELNEYLHCEELSNECLLSFSRYVQDERSASDFAQKYYIIQRDYFVHNFVDKAIELAKRL